MDDLFKALADPTRRALLDSLRRADGQTLSQLCAGTDMTRFGVMKHLATLTASGLVTTVKRGRFRHHYFNAAPLQAALDPWIEPYRQPTRALLNLKTALETPMEPKPDYVLQTYIRCTPQALWEALTDPHRMAAWHFMAHDITRDGEGYVYHTATGDVMMRTRTLDASPPTQIIATFEPAWPGGGAPSRTVFDIAAEGDHCRLTVSHHGLTYAVVAGEGVSDGWDRWAAGLKTYLETGQGVRFAQGAA